MSSSSEEETLCPNCEQDIDSSISCSSCCTTYCLDCTKECIVCMKVRCTECTVLCTSCKEYVCTECMCDKICKECAEDI